MEHKCIRSHHVERVAPQENGLALDLATQHVRGAPVLAAVEVGLGEQVFVGPHIERVIVRDGRAHVRHAAERRPSLGAAGAARTEAAAEAGSAAAVQVQQPPAGGGARRGRGVQRRRQGWRSVRFDADEQLGSPTERRRLLGLGF